MPAISSQYTAQTKRRLCLNKVKVRLHFANHDCLVANHKKSENREAIAQSVIISNNIQPINTSGQVFKLNQKSPVMLEIEYIACLFASDFQVKGKREQHKSRRCSHIIHSELSPSHINSVQLPIIQQRLFSSLCKDSTPCHCQFLWLRLVHQLYQK